jgi:hypothetical protein
MPALKTVDPLAFSKLTSLESVYLPALTNLESSTFANCTALRKVDFPSMHAIYYSPFDGCAALETVILRGNKVVTLSRNTAFDNTPIGAGTGYIYVPDALLASYKEAENWSKYANQFRAIEDYPELIGG